MDLTTVDSAPPEAAGTPRFRVRQVVALAAIVVAVLLALWGTPRSATEAAFGAALRAGDVTSWEPVGSSPGKFGIEGTAQIGITIRQTSGDPTTVIWTDQHGRLYRTSLQNLATLPDPNNPVDDGSGDGLLGPADGNGYQVDLGQTIAATAGAGGHEAPAIDLGPARLLGLPLSLLSLGAVLVLLASAQPRRRTKWGTFWMLGIPAGVGLAWWVLTDSPWSARTDALPEPAPRQRGPVPGVADRRGGGTMLVITVALSLVVGVALLVIVVLPGLGDRPQPPAGSVSWSVVWSRGSTGSLSE